MATRETWLFSNTEIVLIDAGLIRSVGTYKQALKSDQLSVETKAVIGRRLNAAYALRERIKNNERGF